MKIRASLISLSIIPIPRHSTRRHTRDAELPGASMEEDPDRDCGRLLTPARRGRNSKVVVFRKDCSVESESTLLAQIQTFSTLRWKLEQAQEQAEKNKLPVVRQHPVQVHHHRLHRLQ